MTMKYYLQAVLAGALIGMGDLIYVVCANRIVGSLLFSLGLLSILVKGYPLYTGRIGFIDKWSDLWNIQTGMLSTVVCNFIGIGLVCALAGFTRLDLSAVDAMAATKAGQSLFSSLFLSWGCGAMMYLAVNGWRKSSNPILVIMPVMFFILCGFEHCIANYGYFWMWIGEEGFSHFADRFAQLPAGFCVNLVVMVVGNALGSLTFSKI